MEVMARTVPEPTDGDTLVRARARFAPYPDHGEPATTRRELQPRASALINLATQMVQQASITASIGSTANRGRGRWLAIACLVTVAATALLAASGVARANQLVTITVPDRHGEIPSKWLTYSGPPRADVLLPDRFNAGQRYPLIVLLPGFSNTYAILGPSMLDAQKVLAGLQAIVVAPEGEVGWYTDWYNNGAYGTPRWESYILDEVIPQIVQRYKILPQRRYHALFGISMGGLGAAYLGGRLPGFFGSVGVLSGFVDPQIAPAVVSVSMDELSGAPIGSVVGPENGFYATGHNPTALTANLRYTRVFMSAGNGVPTPGDGTGGGVANAEEAGVIRPMSDAYSAALRAAGINLAYHTHTGCHCWPDFQAELRDAIAWGPFKPAVEQRADWVNATAATHGQLWDLAYAFAKHPTAVVRFTRTGSRLQISGAGSPVTLTTSRGCVLHVATPAELRIPSRSCRRKSRLAPRRER
jgi:S-formylglutathione hydrolase FrmB